MRLHYHWYGSVSTCSSAPTVAVALLVSPHATFASSISASALALPVLATFSSAASSSGDELALVVSPHATVSPAISASGISFSGETFSSAISSSAISFSGDALLVSHFDSFGFFGAGLHDIQNYTWRV